jgi:UDP-GlcNAc:undecaprenyl-phosphate/decaprenyl-phosphate GlcNAc-1-phosphate transferase
MIFYFTVFIVALAVSALLTPFVRSIAVRSGLVAAPACSRHLHTTPLPRLGGVAIYFAFLTALAAMPLVARLTNADFSASGLFGILVPALLVFLLGVYDDIKPLQAKTKMAFQCVAGVLLYLGGFGVHLAASSFRGILATAVDLTLTVFWVLLITNAFNLIDGLDGLAAGSAVVSGVAVFGVAVLAHNYLIAALVLALAGATLGFLPFNFCPAQIFMGDSGSLFIGFMLSALVLAGAEEAPGGFAVVVIPILTFGLPILDVTLAVVRRLIRGQSLFRGDADHIHHKLLKRGLSQAQAVVVLYVVTGVFGSLALVVLQGHRLLVPLLLALAAGIYFGVKQLHYAEFSRVSVNFPSTAQHRQIVADRANIHRGAELLRSASDFHAICQVLKETLQPIGFDGIRVHNLGDDGFPASRLHPLQYDSDRTLSFTWVRRRMDRTDGPEHHFEVVISSHPGIGHLSLFGLSEDEDFHQLGLDILSEDFRRALSNAVARAIGGMRTLRATSQNASEAEARAIVAGSPDSI